MRLRAPTLGVAEWQDLSTLGEDVSGSYHQLIARIGHTNLFIDAVAHDAATKKENPSVEEEVMKIAQPFRSLAENCAYLASDANRLAETVRKLPD